MKDIQPGDRVRIGRGRDMVKVTAVNGVFVYFESRQWVGDTKHGFYHKTTQATLKSNITEVA